MQIKRAIPPAALAVLLAACASRPQPPQDLSVIFFDVGPADATLIRTPESETILVDAGRNAQIAQLLRREGISGIDLVALSNAHADHTGGLAAILDSFPVHEIWYSGLDYTREQRAVIERAERYQAVTAGAQKRFAKLTLDVLHPESLPLRPRDSSVNNHSLVLKATYPTARYLFPGDCEEQCWESLFQLHRSDLAADVLKAAFHGAETGTSLDVLASVRPKALVISCGRGNELGQPSPAVLDLAGQRHARVFRTDEQGAIRCLGAACQPGR